MEKNEATLSAENLMSTLNISKNVKEEPLNKSQKRQDYISWDDYFMATAILSAKRSKDPNTQVGACIVDQANLITAIGYNGMPRHCNDYEFPWGKSKGTLEDKNLYVVHAEANAILNKNSVNVIGGRLYTTLFPCNECAKLIIQSGLREVIYLSDRKAEKYAYQASKRMFEAAGVLYKQHTSNVRRIVLEF